MSKFWIITKEVYKKNVKSFGFIAMVLMPLIVVGFIFGIGYYFGQDSEEATPVAVLSEEETAVEMFQAEEWNFDIDESIETEEEADDALAAEEIEGYITVQFVNNTINAEVTHTGGLSETVGLISETLTNYQSTLRASELELSQEEVMSLSEPVVVEEEHVSVEDGAVAEEDLADRGIQQGGAYFVSIAIMMFIMTYAGIIAEEVASEKGSRIMEIILSSATATDHFFGKLTGVMLILLTQIAVYAAVAAAAFFYFRNHELVEQVLSFVDIGDILQELMGYTLIFFITGVLMYVVLAAFFGSLATKMEDVNKVVTPIVFLALFGFYVGMFALAAPENTFNVVVSYIPLFTPFVMPFRIAAESVSTLGIWISVVGTVLFAALISLVSLAFYRSNVLVYSDTNMIGTIKRSWTIMKSNRKARKNKSA